MSGNHTSSYFRGSDILNADLRTWPDEKLRGAEKFVDDWDKESAEALYAEIVRRENEAGGEDEFRWFIRRDITGYIMHDKKTDLTYWTVDDLLYALSQFWTYKAPGVQAKIAAMWAELKKKEKQLLNQEWPPYDGGEI